MLINNNRLQPAWNRGNNSLWRHKGLITGPASGGGGGGGTQVFRALGQAMSVTGSNGLAYGGGSNWSQTTRSRHYSPVAFRHFKIVLQTFDPAGTSPITDTNLTGSFNFQVGLEASYVSGNTGIPARIPITFSSANTVSYTPGSGPFGYIVSDIIDAGTTIAANAFFGLWTTIENALGAGSPTNSIPQQRNASNYLERYIGAVQAASSLIASGEALTATGIAHVSTTRTGISTYFTPCMMLIQVPSTTPCIVGIGDSVRYGIGEGTTDFSGTSGDVMGSALGNPGAYDRGLYENAGQIGVNLGRGNDGNKFLITPSNWPYRLQLTQLANPTHIFNQNGINDCAASITTHGWLSSTAYTLGTSTKSGGNDWVLISPPTGGTSGSVGPTGSPGGTFNDNGLTWFCLQATPANANAQGYATIIGWDYIVAQALKAACPTAKLYGAMVGPNAASTDSFTTTANQTSNWNASTTPPNRRSLVDTNRQTYGSTLMGWSGIININPYIEYNYPTGPSGIWIANNVNANTQTQDGIHPNSSGASVGQSVIQAGTFT